jgi:hypothetical protein
MYFLKYFAEDNVAKIIVIKTKMTVENIIKDDQCVISEAIIPTALNPQIMDAVWSVFG